MRIRTLTAYACAAALIGLGTATLRANIGFLSVDTKVTLVGDTMAIVTGSFVCDSTDTIDFVANVVQEQSGGVITLGQLAGVVCTGFLQTFAIPSTVFVPVDGTLKKGPATVLVSASSTDGVNFDSATISQKGHVGR
jgi:hypothetical protein